MSLELRFAEEALWYGWCHTQLPVIVGQVEGKLGINQKLHDASL